MSQSKKTLSVILHLFAVLLVLLSVVTCTPRNQTHNDPEPGKTSPALEYCGEEDRSPDTPNFSTIIKDDYSLQDAGDGWAYYNAGLLDHVYVSCIVPEHLPDASSRDHYLAIMRESALQAVRSAFVSRGVIRDPLFVFFEQNSDGSFGGSFMYDRGSGTSEGGRIWLSLEYPWFATIILATDNEPEADTLIAGLVSAFRFPSVP